MGAFVYGREGAWVWTELYEGAGDGGGKKLDGAIIGWLKDAHVFQCWMSDGSATHEMLVSALLDVIRRNEEKRKWA